MQSTSIVILIAALAIVAVQYSEARYHPLIDLRDEGDSDNSFIVTSFAERAEEAPACSGAICCTDKCVQCLTPEKTPRLGFCRHDKALRSFVAFKSAESCEKSSSLSSTVLGFAAHENDICTKPKTRK
ncbi:unnamed protein product [Adineta ricciae]|uniref:Uncharacterized protein n=1 Tax=Adineta ricciae TaxID=249248 RepID=A0A815Y2I8_ADIRI|nr:unnamed protein product [Adineta ricciae]CAF1564928.1 unnamed protein product [Adineta ricciae]